MSLYMITNPIYLIITNINKSFMSAVLLFEMVV